MKFLSGVFFGAVISFLITVHFTTSPKEDVTNKDTISIKVADQVVEVPKDTFAKKDSVK